MTAQRRGKGLIVLFHVTADTRWSDLPLAGTFVDMLRRIVALAGSSTPMPTITRPAKPASPAAAPPRSCRPRACSTASAPSRPRRRPPARCRPATRAAPAPIIRPASMDRRKDWWPSTRWHPHDRPMPLDLEPLNARIDVYRHGEPLDLRGPVFIAALALLLIDALVVFWLAGGLTSMMLSRRRATAALISLRPCSPPGRCRIRRTRNSPVARRRRRNCPRAKKSSP